MASLYKQGLAVQREYADKRRRALNKRDEEKITLVRQTIERLARVKHFSLEEYENRFQKPGWEVIYNLLSKTLQSSELTINLEASGWFGSQNDYETYATTYQKHVTKTEGKTVLKTQYDQVGRVTEDADARLYADDRVTLPDDWKNASLLHPQRKRLYKAMSATKGAKPENLKKVDMAEGKTAYEVDNRRFNPNAKQVFAALNYGRRPHGASVYYGYSHIVLRSELKAKAIYFPGDTFAVAAVKDSVQRQCTFETVGAVLAYCSLGMSEDIFQTTIQNHACADTVDPLLLLEAHIFEEVRMNRDVERLMLSRQKKDGTALGHTEWQEVLKNAYAWGNKNKVRVCVMSA